jgi:RNA polymerase sigma-70 factor (ECF subfamily)
MALLVLLEALSPVERAVFMLREVFEYGHPDVARITGKTEVNCRKIFARARQRIAAGGQARDNPPPPARRRKARNSPAGSSRPPRAATWRRCSACSRPTWCSTGTAAAKAQAIGKPLRPGCRSASVGPAAAGSLLVPQVLVRGVLGLFLRLVDL